MKTKHTPGKWFFDAQENVIERGNGEGYVRICDVTKHRPAETKANARLIAAAPELLEALKTITSKYRQNLKSAIENAGSLVLSFNIKELEKIEKAIAKAEK